jgi:hypothetical protein
MKAMLQLNSASVPDACAAKRLLQRGTTRTSDTGTKTTGNAGV